MLIYSILFTYGIKINIEWSGIQRVKSVMDADTTISSPGYNIGALNLLQIEIRYRSYSQYYVCHGIVYLCLLQNEYLWNTQTYINLLKAI